MKSSMQVMEPRLTYTGPFSMGSHMLTIDAGHCPVGNTVGLEVAEALQGSCPWYCRKLPWAFFAGKRAPQGLLSTSIRLKELSPVE